MNKNMKKYKLIKEYPGSPIIGTIAKFEKGKWYCHMIPKLQGSDDELHSLGCGEVKLYPEFWEEVVEKDYEILSLARLCSIKPKITDVSDYGDGYIEALLKCDNARIHSVKRLSDGEIFTIGDKIFPNNKIYKFELKNDILKIWHCDISFSTPIIEGPSGQPGNCSWIEGISNIKKIKQPLFTTEDSVDIFDYSKDHFYYVKKESFKLCENLKVTNSNVTFKYEPEKELYFSTKEKAEEYILMNKPCLSLNDVAKVYVSAGFEITNSNKNIKYVKQQLQLRELIKTKLKKAL